MKSTKKNTKDKKLTKNIKKMQVNTNSKRMSNKEKAKWSEMNQIDWFPIDPYCD